MISSIAAAVLVIITLAQLEERRRFKHLIAAREAWLAQKERAQQLILNQYALAGAPPAKDDALWAKASAPAAFPPLTPEHRRPVTRLRRALALGAFVIWMELLGLAILGTTKFKRRHAPVIAHAMIAASVLGTSLMLLGPRFWRHWRDVDLTADPAGLGLIAVFISAAVFLMVHFRTRDRVPRRTRGGDDEADLSSSS